VAEGDLDAALDRREHDENVERVSAKDGAKIDHRSNVLRAPGGRVLLE